MAVLLTLGACNAGDQPARPVSFAGEVKVGILHSLTGTMATSESSVAEGEVLAIDEINRAGGVRIGGKLLKIVPVAEDGASDGTTFAVKAKKLIEDDRVAVVFGGWTSASRKAMLPVFEAGDHLLFYPIQYEGQECSKNIFYAGATPNQQAEPAVDWLFRNKGKRFFLVGSDYVYPRTANTIIKSQLKAIGGALAGEEYIPLGSADLGPIITKIRQALPDGGVIVNTLNGDSNVQFFKQLRAAYLTNVNGYSIMSFSIAEEDVASIGPEYLEGTYGAWNFFQSLDSPASRKFTKFFKTRYGDQRLTSDPAEAGYLMVHLWAKAAEKADGIDPVKVRNTLIGMTFDAPEGLVEVQPNHHLSKRVLIGEVQKDGMFRIIDNKGVQKPVAWSQFVPDSNGFTCDWTQQRSDAGRFKM